MINRITDYISNAFTFFLRNGDLKKLPGILRQSLAGNEQDFTQGSLRKAIILLSVPMVLEMLMESVFAVVDIFFVSRLGAEAVATVGLTESIITLVYAISFGLATATTAMVSRKIGEKDPEKASHIAFQAVLTGFAASLLIAIPGIFFAKDILRLMGASEIIVEQMSGYTSIMLGSNTVIMMLFIINAVFRSAGDAAIAMKVLWVGNIINIILDPLLIFGLGPFPELGIEGAAWATAIGRGTAVCFQLYLLFYGSKRIKLKRKNLHIDFLTIFRLLKLSLGAMGQNIIATSSWIGLMRIMAIYGSVALAGYTIAIRIIIFALLPSFGVSNAASTLVGQNLGAKNPRRAERSVFAAAKVNMALLGSVGLIFILFPRFFISLLISDPAVIEAGAEGLRFISFGFAFYGLGMVMVNAINGAGDTTTPTLLNLICFWLIEIPLAYLLAVLLNMQNTGVYISIIAAESLLALLALYWFRRGKWKEIAL
jgi:putative MATE family efflux protein